MLKKASKNILHGGVAGKGGLKGVIVFANLSIFLTWPFRKHLPGP